MGIVGRTLALVGAEVKYPAGVCYDSVMATSDDTDHAHGYTPEKAQLVKRLARIEGQVRGVARMVEDDRYCIDVLTQISAVQAAIDKVAIGLMDDHVRHCVLGAEGDERDAKAEELMAAVGRLVRSR